MIQDTAELGVRKLDQHHIFDRYSKDTVVHNVVQVLLAFLLNHLECM